MFELILRHRYGAGTLADSSGYGNHGHRVLAAGRAPETAPADTTSYDGGTRVVVFPSTSLADLGGIRIRARIRVSDLGQRRTIVEGYLAFSLAVEPDGALAGAVYTGLHWNGLTTPAGAVPLGQWVDVTYLYDGLDTSMLSVDGVIVAISYAPLGPAGGVAWPYGLNIGAWPDADLRIFKGSISELWLWKLIR